MRPLLTPLLAALLALPALADIITLKNGRVIEGDVVSDDGKTVKVKLKYGSLSLEKSEIASIEEKLTPEQEYEERKAKLDEGSADEQLALAEWLQSKKMNDEATRHFIAAATLDPSCMRAVEALEKADYHLVAGEWQDPDTYYPSRGYVRWEGHWIHPLEHSWRLSVQLLDKLESKLSAARARAGRARAAMEHAEAATAAAERVLDAAPQRRADLQQEIADLELERRQAERRASSAERDVDKWDVIYEQERLKASRGEPNSAGFADLELRKAKRALAGAETEMANCDLAITARRKSLSLVDAEEAKASRDLARAEDAEESAKKEADEAAAEARELEEMVAEQEKDVEAAREAFSKVK